MMEFMASAVRTVLPLMLVTNLICWVFMPHKNRVLTFVIAVVFASLFIYIPWEVSWLGSPITNYVEAFSNHLSICSIIGLAMGLVTYVTKKTMIKRREMLYVSYTTAATGLLFYPLALGISYVDPYIFGYNPTGLFCIISVLAIVCWINRFYVTAITLALCLISYNIELFGFNNLWDYLLDPVFVLLTLIYACYHFLTMILPTRPQRGLLMLQRIHRAEKVMLFLVFGLVITGVILSFLEKTYFKEVYVVEDGLIEWLTVAGLFLCMLSAIRRAYFSSLHKDIPKAFFALFCMGVFMFGLGEEISWGQRIFDIESPGFFLTHNAQEELNFHNLKVAGIKINKLVFGTLLAIFIVSYLLLARPLYSRLPLFKKQINKYGIPIPEIHHIVAYALLFIFISIIPTSKRGELLEFGGVYLFFMIFTFPWNINEIEKHLIKQQPAK